MCQTTAEIKANDIVIKDLMNYESDYEVEKSSGSNGENEFRLLITRVMIANRVDSIQIKQDLQPLAETMRKCPSLISLFRDKPLKTTGVVALLGFFIFIALYTFV